MNRSNKLNKQLSTLEKQLNTMSKSHGNGEKPHVGGFKLSSNFNQLYTQKKEEAAEFIKDISQNRQSAEKQKSRQKSHKKIIASKSAPQGSLFKLNTKSDALIDQVPVQVLKKRSQSRLESMQDEDASRNRFSMLQHEQQKNESRIKERRQLFKKYNIDLNAVMSQQNLPSTLLDKNVENRIEQEDPEGTVKPSQLYKVNTKITDPFSTPTIFQTPLLPCFASEFSPNPQLSVSKAIREGEGVWRIGKIKIKGNKAVLKVGQIQFESQLVSSEGNCVSIKDDFMYRHKNWNGIWVCQPKEEDF